MKIRTFLATYLLFLVILFSSLGSVSVYMMNHQVNMLMRKGMAEYQTISAALLRDIIVLANMSGDFFSDVDMLVSGYARHYRQHNIIITLNYIPAEYSDDSIEISFISESPEYFVFATGRLAEPFNNFRLNYYYNASESIADTRNVQNILLVICIAFSVITAIALHFIIYFIFKPLGIVAKTSREIADGNYSERIKIKGRGELSAMAGDFNKMAEEIETQIQLLEEEAIRKQQFVDNFAHEIRTPLTSVYGYAEYMQKVSLSEEEIIESAQFIMDEAGHMRKIANSLLELATLRNYKAIKSEIIIMQLFDDIYQTMKKQLDEHGSQLILNANADILLGQEDLIKSLLLNLCVNALSACTPGEGIIYLDAACLEAKKKREDIIISVSDNGHGIPSESISELTEPFYRVNKARSREHGGVGLGLALCKQIADAHSAILEIESDAGQGTIIKIRFTGS